MTDAVRDAVSLGLLDLAWVDGCPLLASARGLPEFARLREQLASRAARVRDILLDARIAPR